MVIATLLLFSLSLHLDSAKHSPYPTVVTSSGSVEGFCKKYNDKEALVFLGIPYAKPPTGKLRFKPPVEYPRSGQKIYAKKYGKSCTQFTDVTYITSALDLNIPEWSDTSEDCLYLNIITPSPKPYKAPVMVWIHGGAFRSGTSAVDKYDGGYLSTNENVIVVTVNYRLSSLGFIYLGCHDAPGNVGLLDQFMALKWIRMNIANFGGNPSLVTLFGQSAGASCIGFHLLNPATYDYFRRSILQSGSSTSIWASRSKERALQISQNFSSILNCNTGHESCPEIMSCLRTKSRKELLDATMSMPQSPLLFIPVIDGAYIKEDPKKSVKEHRFKNCIMLGDNKNDGIFFPISKGVIGVQDFSFIKYEKLYAYIRETAMTKSPCLNEMMRFLYTNWENPYDEVALRKRLIEFSTDFQVACSTTELSESASASGKEVYRYRFSHRPSISKVAPWAGAIHTNEASFVFGYPTDPASGYNQKEADLARTMMKFWANFAKTGNPNSEYTKNKWHLYRLDDPVFLDIGMEIKPALNDRVAYCAFWNHIVRDPRWKTDDHCSNYSLS